MRRRPGTTVPRGILRPLAILALLTAVPLTAVPLTALGQARIAEVNGVALPFEITGEGTPLVLIHGWAVHRGYWDDDVARLASGYRVIRYDRRGFGEASGKPDLTADAADLAALLDQLGIERAHLVGHSQGALVALTFALRYPDRVGGLVLFGSGLLPGQAPPPDASLPPVQDWIALGQRDGVEALREAAGSWATANFGGPMEGLEARARAMLSTYSGADLLDPAAPLNLAKPAESTDLSAIQAPTLVVNGEQDLALARAAAGLLADGIPGARRVTISGAGHTANWQRPDQFASIVLEFLRSVDRTGR